MMPRPSFARVPALIAALTALVAGCSKRPDESAQANSNGQGTDPSGTAAPAPTNRIDVPAPVRQNLGITFATVERRAVAQTIRVPGRFELLPDAKREYRTMLAGQVELTVSQFQQVEAGAVMYRLRSLRWREMQQQIAEAEAAIRSVHAASETIGPLRQAHRVHEESLNETVGLWTERVKQLEEIRQAGGGKADELAQARATLTTSRAELADVMEKDAELEAREREITAQLEAARTRMELLISSAATVVGLPAADLVAPSAGGAAPRWRTVDLVEVRAAAPGVVDALAVTNGSWVEESSLVLSTAQPERLRFHARGLQSDLGRFRDGLPARVTPPSGGTVPLQDVMEGSLLVGFGADPDQRTVDLYVTPDRVKAWAKPGIAAHMEITLAGGAEELAVPLSAIARDGLNPILFRRDPKNPDTVIRLDADLGIDDGRWAVVKSGVREGDEVVLDGVYQLMLATSGSAQRGGHFHSDGTFHEGEGK